MGKRILESEDSGKVHRVLSHYTKGLDARTPSSTRLVLLKQT